MKSRKYAFVDTIDCGTTQKNNRINNVQAFFLHDELKQYKMRIGDRTDNIDYEKTFKLIISLCLYNSILMVFFFFFIEYCVWFYDRIMTLNVFNVTTRKPVNGLRPAKSTKLF